MKYHIALVNEDRSLLYLLNENGVEYYLDIELDSLEQTFDYYDFEDWINSNNEYDIKYMGCFYFPGEPLVEDVLKLFPELNL